MMVLVCLMVTGCKKDQPAEPTYHTIYPLEYYPVFPGSFWEYRDLDSNVTRHETEPEYMLYKDELLPFLNQGFGNVPIKKYKYPAVGGWDRILSVGGVGTSWEMGTQATPGSPYSIREVTAKDTTLTINSTQYYPVIEVTDYVVPVYNSKIEYDRSYYAKDVGLIRYERFAIGYPDSISERKDLVSYYINN